MYRCTDVQYVQYVQYVQCVQCVQLKCREYDRDNSGRISEADLCKFLLKNTKVSKGKQ